MVSPSIPERSKKLIRQFKRYLGSKTAEQDILAIAESLESGKTDLDTGPLKKFPDFVSAIDTVYAEYEDRLHMSARNIEISSKELTSAFSEVESLNISINAMLNSLEEALLFFDADGMCSDVFSASARTLFATDPGNKKITDVIPFTLEEKENFHRWLAIIFAGNTALDFDDIKKLLPSEFKNSNGRFIELDYRPMYFYEDKIMGILLVGTDVTDQRAAEKRLKELQEHNQKILSISKNRNAFKDLINELGELSTSVQEIKSYDVVMAENKYLMRQFHNYKGIAGVYHLFDLIEQIHLIETSLVKIKKDSSFKKLLKELEKLDALLLEESAFARSIFGEEFMNEEEMRLVSMSDLMKLQDMLQNNDDSKNARDFLSHDIIASPLSKEFDAFTIELNRLALQLGKPEPNIEIETGDIKIFPGHYGNVFETFIHIARNIIDHGIENEDKRRARDKSTQGLVRVKAQIIKEGSQERLLITIQDDGRGIDPQKVREKLIESNQDIPDTTSDEDIINYTFQPSFSLNSKVSLISGRGVGMDSVKEAIEAVGGVISVHSDYHNRAGTILKIELPYDMNT